MNTLNNCSTPSTIGTNGSSNNPRVGRGALVTGHVPRLTWFFVVLGIMAWPLYGAPRPVGEAGPGAEALAQAMQQAVDVDSWAQTRAVSWNFRGQREHLWDRDGSRARVRWNKTEVLLDLIQQRGIAYRRGARVDEKQNERLVAEAYAHWVNDSFWLNPVAKVFDQGTRRSLVSLAKPVFEGASETALLVEYSSGGLTPGDAYLWHLDEGRRPVGWQMWTSNIPVGGARASWQGWLQLATGASVATQHKLRVGRVDLQEVVGASSLAELLSRLLPAEAAPFQALEARNP